MSIYREIRDKFVELLGEPTSEEHLKEYYNRYGYVNKYENEIKDITNETN